MKETLTERAWRAEMAARDSGAPLKTVRRQRRRWFDVAARPKREEQVLGWPKRRY